MKRMISTRLLQFATILAAGAFATACSGSNPAAPTVPAPAAATVSSVLVTSAPSSGTSFQLTAVAHSTDGSAKDVTGSATWLSSNTQLATISTGGVVTVIGAGDVDL